MKRSSKFLSLLLSLAMIVSLFVPAMAADETPAYVIPDVRGKVVILHTNDTHGADLAVKGKSIGAAGVAQLKKDFEAAGAKVLLLSAGDAIMGNPLVSANQGQSAVEFMNAAGYDAMTAGNHELDFGFDNLKALAKLAKFPVLSANMMVAATGERVFDANKIFDLGGVKVGVFGLSTPETLTKADASKMPGITFPQGDALYKIAQAQVDELKKAGAEFIVCLGHLGVADESKGNQSIDVCENVTGIDLFIDGHSHSTTADVIKVIGGSTNVAGSTKIVSTGTALANVGLVIYDKSTKTLTDSLISAAAYTKADQTVAKLVSDRNEAVKKQYGEPIATTDVDLNGSRSGGAATAFNTKAETKFSAGQGVRTAETNLGDFAADAILWQARKILGSNQVDLAITNGGGIRETLGKGNISKLDLLAVFPFGNTVATIQVTGAELLEALEAATYTTPDAIGAFPQVSGVEFTVKTAIPYINGEKYPSSTYYAPKISGTRVTITSVSGKAFDAKATYTIATNDFTAKGGDTFGVFKRVGGWKDIGITLENALINYVGEELGGKITAEKYGKAAGRITINNLPLDVKGNEWFMDAVSYTLKAKVMTGTGAGYFAPEGTVTRATVFQTLYNMAGAPQDELKTSFTDLSGKWYAKAAAWAESTGLAAVPANGLFNGDRAITRAEIATVIARASANRQLPQDTGAMKNVPDYAAIPAWALDGMTWSYYSKVITGKSGGLLDPSGNALRSELAQILLNLSKIPVVYTEKKVAIEVPAQGGVPAHTVAGILTVPTAAKKDAKVPGIVMLHGTGSNKDEAGGGYAIAAPAMAMNGLASLRIDFMGTAPDKAADYKHYSYTSANIDAKAAADYLAKLENVDGTKLGVMGWSQGGTNALLAAAKYPETFKSVVTWAGALNLKGLAGADFNKAYETAKKDGSYTLKLDWRNPSELPMGVQWFEDVKNTDVLAQVAQIKAPILAINGAKDDVVVPKNAEEIAAAAKNIRSGLHIVEGADHTFNVFTGDFSALIETIAATNTYFLGTLTADYMEVSVTVANGSREIPAIVTIPAGDGPFASVVMNHGHGGSKDEGGGFAGVAYAMAEQGIMSIRMDFPGCGESDQPFTENYLSNMISDSNACKDYLIANFPVNQSKLGILGYSMGGRIAATIIGGQSSPYKAAVLLAGAVGDGQALAYGIVGGKDNYEKAYNTAKTEGKYTITTQYGQVQDLSQKWFDDMVASKPLDGAKNFSGPVLVIYGDKDNVVAPAMNKLSVAAYKNVSEIVVKDANHGYGFYSNGAESAVTAAVEGGISSFFASSFGLNAVKKAA